MMPVIYRFHMGQRVLIVAQQSTGVIRVMGTKTDGRTNFYIVQIDPDQPLVTSDGDYTAFENELQAAPPSHS